MGGMSSHSSLSGLYRSIEFRLERVPSSRLLPPTAYTKLSITATPGREGGGEEGRKTGREGERNGGGEGGRQGGW